MKQQKLVLVDQAERFAYDRDGFVIDHHFELRMEADFPMNWSVEEVVAATGEILDMPMATLKNGINTYQMYKCGLTYVSVDRNFKRHQTTLTLFLNEELDVEQFNQKVNSR
jgi:hypothetical protein